MGAYDPSTRLSLDFDAARFYLPADIHRAVAEKIEHHGTHESYINLVRRSVDLIIVAREPSDDEIALASEKGVRIRFTPVALDAFVFIVNTNNSVRNLSVQQIRAIYTGTLTNWSQIGGSEERINPYQRNKNSGSQEMMEKLVMHGQKMVESSSLEVPLAMIGPFNAIRHDRKGIGYTFQYYDTYMTHIPEVRTIAVNGVEPNAGNIRKRTYPFVSEVVIAWLDDLPKGSPAQIVRDWILSEDGQRLVAESGYVPLK
jgi:phosphate transport system substrate-binding protein